MQTDERRNLIEMYRDGYTAVAEVLQGITADELDARPGPGRWTAREIVHHLADSEMTAAIRLRRLLAEDRPAIQGYDQEEFARRLCYDRPHEASLELFRACARRDGRDPRPPHGGAVAREGTHSEVGAYSVEAWLEIYSQHAHRTRSRSGSARGKAEG
jgi:hypothetical protein